MSQASLVNKASSDTRMMLYPKLRMWFALEIKHRKFACYVSVKTVIQGETYFLGYTDTITEKKSVNSVAAFSKYVDVTYQVAVDDNQMLIFEIFDGDTFTAQKGYLFSYLEMSVGRAMRPELRLPILQGEDLLGYLLIKSTLDYDVQEASIRNAVRDLTDVDINDKEVEEEADNNISTVGGFKNQKFFDRAVMGHFAYKPKTLDEFRAEIEEIEVEFGFYKFGIATKKISPYTDKYMDDKGSNIFIRLCLNHDPRPEDPDEDEGPTLLTKEEHYKSDELHVLWESTHIMKAPYEVEVSEVRLTHEELTGTDDLKASIPKDLKIVMQVYVTGLNPNPLIQSDSLVGYRKMSVRKFIRVARDAAAKNRRKPVPLRYQMYRELSEFEVENKADADVVKERMKFSRFRRKSSVDRINQKELEKRKKEIEDQEQKSKKGIFGKLVAKVKRKKDDDEESVNSFDQELVNITEPFDEEDDDDDDDDDGDDDDDDNIGYFGDNTITLGSPNAKNHLEAVEEEEEDAKSLFGNMTVMVYPRETRKIPMTKGDKSYEAQIVEKFKVFQEQWVEGIDHAFHDISDQQTERTMQATFIFEALLEGWNLVPSIVVDLNEACYDTWNFTRLNKKSWEDELGISVCRKAMYALYDVLGELAKDNIVKAYAGGGVSAPTPGGKDGDGCEQHPAFGFERNIAVPLTDEIDIALRENTGRLEKMTKYAAHATNADPLQRLVHLLLKEEDTPGYWGGTKYVQEQQYDTRNVLHKGITEAMTLYQPLLWYAKDLDDTVGEEEEMEELRNSAAKERRKTVFNVGTEFFEEDISEMVKNRVSVIHGGSLPDMGSEWFQGLPPNMRSYERTDIDLDAIKLLLEEPGEAKDAQFVVWIMGKSPPKAYEYDLERLFKRQMKNHNTRAALLVVLAAEVRHEYDNDDLDLIKELADPFKMVYDAYDGAARHIIRSRRDRKAKTGTSGIGSEISDEEVKEFQAKQGRLSICHFITMKEILASAFLKEDDDNRRQMAESKKHHDVSDRMKKMHMLDEKRVFPFLHDIYETMVMKFKIYAPTAFRVCGLQQLTPEHHAMLVERDLEAFKSKKLQAALDEKFKERNQKNRKSQRKSMRQMLVQSASRISFKGMFAHKEVEEKEEEEDHHYESYRRVKRSLQDRVNGYKEIQDLRERWESESLLSFQAEIRKSVSRYLNQIVVEANSQRKQTNLFNSDGSINFEGACTIA